mgnify:CR=1 FL=1
MTGFYVFLRLLGFPKPENPHPGPQSNPYPDPIPVKLKADGISISYQAPPLPCAVLFENMRLTMTHPVNIHVYHNIMGSKSL